MDLPIEPSDLDRLTPQDKVELRQFINNEQQRSRVQAQTHNLTDKCWKKCVAPSGTIKSDSLSSSEQSCMANCVERFMDVNLATLKHLSSIRQQQQH